MSSQEERKCCVCGAPSTMRCSACSQAGVDLYFCSTEHQKFVWFAHKPVCGPLRASFMLLPDLTPFETRLLQLPSFLQALPQLRAPGTRYATIGETIVHVEREHLLIPGSFMLNLHRMNEWLKSLGIDLRARGTVRLVVNSALSGFVHSQDGGANDPLEMPAHSFALDCFWWLILTRIEVLPQANIIDFAHGATVWAGLLRIVAGRVTVAGVDTSFVTPEFVRVNLERLLQTIQADLDLAIDVFGGGLLTLVPRSLQSVPAISRFKVRISTVAGDPASNRISVDDSADASDAEPFAPTARERHDDLNWVVDRDSLPVSPLLLRLTPFFVNDTLSFRFVYRWNGTKE